MLDLSEMLAGSTGLEPAASGVTGRRSNQLNYDPIRTDADKAERGSFQRSPFEPLLMGGTGFEPVTAGV